MKRIKVRPGKFIFVSDEVLRKVEQAAKAVSTTREEAERIIAEWPRERRVHAGRLWPRPVRLTPRKV